MRAGNVMSHLQMRVKIEDFNTVGTRLHPHMIVLHLLTFRPGVQVDGGLEGGVGEELLHLHRFFSCPPSDLEGWEMVDWRWCRSVVAWMLSRPLVAW